MLYAILDTLTIIALLGGLFFMIVASIGLLRMPDIYHRVHASTKGVTLGISGLLLAMALAMSFHPDATPLAVTTKALLVILFQFVANPVGAHLLAKAAHLDGCPTWKDTLSDDLKFDKDTKNEDLFSSRDDL